MPGTSPHVSHASSLLKALFVGEGASGGGSANGGSGGGGGGGGLETGGFAHQQAPRFGLFNGPATSNPNSAPLDQAPAPLLTLLESKVFFFFLVLSKRYMHELSISNLTCII